MKQRLIAKTTGTTSRGRLASAVMKHFLKNDSTEHVDQTSQLPQANMLRYQTPEIQSNTFKKITFYQRKSTFKKVKNASTPFRKKNLQIPQLRFYHQNTPIQIKTFFTLTKGYAAAFPAAFPLGPTTAAKRQSGNWEATEYTTFWYLFLLCEW